MKNSIILLLFLFAFTVTSNAQEAKSNAKKESCCTADQKAACATDNSKCCTIAATDKKKCCAKDKSKAVSAVTGKHSCAADGSCCGDCKEPKAKS